MTRNVTGQPIVPHDIGTFNARAIARRPASGRHGWVLPLREPITRLQIARLAGTAAEDKCQDIALPESILTETVAALLAGLI